MTLDVQWHAMPLLRILHIHLPLKWTHFHPKPIITISIGSYFGMDWNHQAAKLIATIDILDICLRKSNTWPPAMAATEVSGDAALKLLKEPEVWWCWRAGWLIFNVGVSENGRCEKNNPKPHRFQYLKGLILDDLGVTPVYPYLKWSLIDECTLERECNLSVGRVFKSSDFGVPPFRS